MAALVDSYTIYDNDGRVSTGNFTTANQSFTNTNEIEIFNAKFFLSKVGTITGNCCAKLYAHTGTYGTSSVPTGAVLATSDAVDVSTLTVSSTLTTFNFSTRYLMAVSTYYCIVLEYTGGDVDNYVVTKRDLTTLTASGNYSYWNGSAWAYVTNREMAFYVYGFAPVLGAAEFSGAGDMSVAGLGRFYGLVEFTGAGDMSAAAIVIRLIQFLEAPEVTTRMAFATHVIVNSPTNTGTANITPEPAAANRIYRLINIDTGDAALCNAVAAELIARWGKDQVSVSGPIPLDVRLLFMTKVQIIVPEAALNSALILQRKEHDILSSTTTIVCGDIILSDDELLARILDKLG